MTRNARSLAGSRCTVEKSGGAGRRRTGRLAAGAPVALLLALFAAPLVAQCVAVTQTGTIVAAHDRLVDLYDADGQKRIWRANSVAYAGSIAVGDNDVAVLDPIENRVVIVDLESGTPRSLKTAETPIAAVFVGRELFVLDRDARIVERIAPTGGARATVAVADDPAFLRRTKDKLYVCSRTGGSLQEITLSPFAVSRSIAVPRFASSLQVLEPFAYLAYPTGERAADLSGMSRGQRRVSFSRRGSLVAVDLYSMEVAAEAPVGAVPVGLGLYGGAANTSVMVAVADPSSKRIWMIEGQTSALQAMSREEFHGRVTLRPVESVGFDSGIDRVSVIGDSQTRALGVGVAYDSSSGTLYRFSKRESSVLARGVGPNAWTAVPGGAAWWQNGTLVAQKVNR